MDIMRDTSAFVNDVFYSLKQTTRRAASVPGVPFQSSLPFNGVIWYFSHHFEFYSWNLSGV